MRRFLFLAAIAAFLWTGATTPAPARPTARFAQSAEAIEFELFRGTRIFFQGTVNGRPASMLLDSGAGSTVVNADFARQVGLGEGEPHMVRGIGGLERGRLVGGVTLAAGPLTVADTPVLVLDLNEIATQMGRRVDVILGLEFFRAGIVDIDFPGRKLRFLPGRDFTPPAGSVAVPISEGHGRRTIPVSINGAPAVPADLDIGHGGALILARSYWEKDAAVRALPWAPTTRGGVGGRVPKRSVTLPFVEIAGHRFEAVPAVLNEGAADIPVTGANVGIDLLQRFRLAFDLPRRTLYMTPDAREVAKPFPKDRLGMRLVFEGDRLWVAEVVQGSPAAKAGWRVGDEVVSVGGRKVAPGFYDTPQSRWPTMPAGTRLDLVRIDGKAMPVVLRDFF